MVRTIEERIAWVEATIASHDHAHSLAERVLDARLEKLNELRSIVADQSARFASRESVDDLRERVIRREGTDKGIGLSWSAVLAVVAIAIAAISLFR